jgi:hypothetical protein
VQVGTENHDITAHGTPEEGATTATPFDTFWFEDSVAKISEVENSLN